MERHLLYKTCSVKLHWAHTLREVDTVSYLFLLFPNFWVYTTKVLPWWLKICVGGEIYMSLVAYKYSLPRSLRINPANQPTANMILLKKYHITHGWRPISVEGVVLYITLLMVGDLPQLKGLCLVVFRLKQCAWLRM